MTHLPFSLAPAIGKTGDTKWVIAAWSSLGFGVIIVLVLGIANTEADAFSAAMAGILLAGAATLIGGFIGFLFGIPRSKQGQAPVSAAAGSSGQREYLENTNLEQISDWLTKIIVGLTLVQYDKIQAAVVLAGTYFAPALWAGDANLGTAIGVAVIVYFSIVGFLFAYLWTRIHMESVLRWQSLQLSVEIAGALEQQRQDENDADAAAFELTDAYLEVQTDPAAPAFRNIEAKVAASSLIARTLIFERARKVRRDSWRAPVGDPVRQLVDRTIPIFRGLVAASPNRHHRNYGQLGYALIKAVNPDWAAAKSALETAIRLRSDEDDSGRGYYELCLAIALVNLDAGFGAGKKSDASTRNRIEALLKNLPEDIDLRDEKVLIDWAALNDVSLL